MVTVAKKDKIRICLDPTDLNKVVLRPHYPMPTLEEIIDDLQGAKIFSTFDVKSGYW